MRRPVQPGDAPPGPLSPGVARYSQRVLPSVRYLPGRSPRPRDAAGAFEDAAGAALLRERWTACAAYLYGIDCYNHGCFWECHEVLEPLWRASGRGTAERRLLRALIQLSASHLKWITGAARPARALAEKARAGLGDLSGVVLGVDVAALDAALARRLADAAAPPEAIRLRMPSSGRGSGRGEAAGPGASG